ncbi:MAG TPA: alkaline phosphatase D family protein [Nocardioides sp.]
MTPAPGLDRRTFVKGAAVATAALAVPLRGFDAAVAAAPASRGIFGYGVASGDPTGDAVVIWTRATPPPRPGEPVATPGSGLGSPLNVVWQVSTDPAFENVIREGNVHTHASSDHTVKVDVTGLAAYTAYWYRFKARGETSPVGRTQTAGDEPGTTHALRFALASCSNYTGGWFGAYREIARRDDLDFVLHVGDYIYEYGNGADRYGPPELIGVRDGQPATETIDLQGYRLRHALHKADDDLKAAHARHPWITIFDDHEVANNAWSDGAENHQAGEGDYLARRDQALQAYLEWMPFRLPDQSQPHQGTRFFRQFTYGDLGDLTILETRQNRSKQVDPPGGPSVTGFVPIGLDPRIDQALADPTRHLPEPEQLEWVKAAVATTGRQWHLLGNQVMVIPFRLPGAVLGAPGTTLVNADAWDGYGADQRAFLAHLAAQPAEAGDAVVLTGDIHSSWAADLPADPASTTSYTSAGVEFVTPSVTSDGFYELSASIVPAGTTPEQRVGLVGLVAGQIKSLNPWTKYLDGVGHGFVVIDVTPSRVQADYFHTPTPTSAMPDPRVVRDVVPAYKRSMRTVAGSRQVTGTAGPVGARSDHPAGA